MLTKMTTVFCLRSFFLSDKTYRSNAQHVRTQHRHDSNMTAHGRLQGFRLIPAYLGCMTNAVRHECPLTTREEDIANQWRADRTRKRSWPARLSLYFRSRRPIPSRF